MNEAYPKSDKTFSLNAAIEYTELSFFELLVRLQERNLDYEIDENGREWFAQTTLDALLQEEEL
jgi:hypothetical protein